MPEAYLYNTEQCRMRPRGGFSGRIGGLGQTRKMIYLDVAPLVGGRVKITNTKRRSAMKAPTSLAYSTKAVYWTLLLLLGLVNGAERVIIKVPTLIDLYKDDTCSHDHINVESEAIIRDE